MASDCLDDLLNGEDGDEFDGAELDYEDEEALLQEEDMEQQQMDEMNNDQEEENDVIDLQAEEDLSLTLNSEKLDNSYQERKKSVKERLSEPRNGRKFVLRRNNDPYIENETHPVKTNNNFNRPSNYNNNGNNYNNNNNNRMGINRVQQQKNRIPNRRNFPNRMQNGRNSNAPNNQPQQLQKRSNTVLINPRFKGVVTVTDARVVWDQQPGQNPNQRQINPWNQTENQPSQNMPPMMQQPQQPIPLMQQQYPMQIQQNQFQQMGPPQQHPSLQAQQPPLHMQQPINNMDWKNQNQYYSTPSHMNSSYEEHPFPQKPNVHDRLGHRQQFPAPVDSAPMQMTVMNPHNFHNPPVQQGVSFMPPSQPPPPQNFNNYQQPAPHFMPPQQPQPQPNPPMFMQQQQFNNNPNMMPQQFNQNIHGFQNQQPHLPPPQLFNKGYQQMQQQPHMPMQNLNFHPQNNQQMPMQRAFPDSSQPQRKVIMVAPNQHENHQNHHQNNQMWHGNPQKQFNVQQANFQQGSFNQTHKFQLKNRQFKRNVSEGSVGNVQRKLRRVEKPVYQNETVEFASNVQKVVPVQIDPNEDEETRQYRLKIEEQKRKREEILRQKEQRRLEMAKLAKSESEDETTPVFNKNPKPTTAVLINKPKPVIPKANLVVNNAPFKNRNRVVLPPSQNNVNFSNNISIKCIPNASMAVDPTNDVDDQHLSSFLSKRTVLAKDQQLMDSRLVLIKNLSDSTPNRKILTMCKEIGDVQKLQRKKSDREAIILFKSVASAHAFYKKYQRYMLDLSMIEVSLKPMQGAICNS